MPEGVTYLVLANESATNHKDSREGGRNEMEMVSSFH